MRLRFKKMAAYEIMYLASKITAKNQRKAINYPKLKLIKWNLIQDTTIMLNLSYLRSCWC